jgi:hypothetical protein
VSPIVVRPAAYDCLGPDAPEPDCAFYVISDRAAAEAVIEPNGAYHHCGRRVWDERAGLGEVLAGLPEPAHVLVIAPSRVIESPTEEEIGRRKLLCVPCGSTPMPGADIAHFLGVLERTSAAVLERRASEFFDRVETAERLVIRDEEYGVEAQFDHLADGYEWNQQAGYVGWGEQQVVPGGELSVIPGSVMSLDTSQRLRITGTIALRGTPIVHAGSARYSPAEQEALYMDLLAAERHAVLIDLVEGEVDGVHDTHGDALPAARALDGLFDADPRYRVVKELGFGLNPALELLPGNRAMNEMYGSRDGVVHLGIGLTPFTTFAPIIICPGISLLAQDGRYILGLRARVDTRPRLIRRKVPACVCLQGSVVPRRPLADVSWPVPQYDL